MGDRRGQRPNSDGRSNLANDSMAITLLPISLAQSTPGRPRPAPVVISTCGRSLTMIAADLAKLLMARPIIVNSAPCFTWPQAKWGRKRVG
jgi:hypothetical protein